MSVSSELPDLTATHLARLIRTGEVSATEVMAAHLERVQQWNPQINAVVAADFDRAVAGARAADAAQARGEPLGALHGLPVAHKDLFSTKGTRTTFGSLAFEDYVPEADVTLVERQRLAGAIAIGKTNTPEFGAGSHTFNSVYGMTRNPYAPDRSAGGSSGGAAAALASGMVALADGSDMGGSLRNPASFCNIVGLRPSFGRVPYAPNAGRFNPLSVAGPMGRTVEDVALFLETLAGFDARDPLSFPSPEIAYSKQLQRDFSNVRIAWGGDLGGLPFEPEVMEITRASLGVFADLGCRVEAATPPLEGAHEAFHTLRAMSFANAYRETLKSKRDKLKDTVIWNIEKGLRLTVDDILDAQAQRTRLFERLREFTDTYEFIVAPVSQVLPFPVEQEYPAEIAGVPQATYIDWQQSAYVFSVAGNPAISVPCGFSKDGTPVGVQIIGRYRDELGVLQLAHAFEQLTQHHRRRPVRSTLS